MDLTLYVVIVICIVLLYGRVAALNGIDRF